MVTKCKICNNDCEINCIQSGLIKTIDCLTCGKYNMTREFYDDFEAFQYNDIDNVFVNLKRVH